ncbi:MAG: MBL fold metallo-hydrolase [archaeon]|nr:MBL fold metallo-hydrolase [archaeon]
MWKIELSNIFFTWRFGFTMGNVIFENEEISIVQQELGQYENLNHLIVCKKTCQAAIIDPFDGPFWLDYCSTNNLRLVAIWLTHSHWDHTRGVEAIVDQIPDIPVILHAKEVERGWDGPLDFALSHEEWTSSEIQIGEILVHAHLTPGHTPGHLTFVHQHFVASGDCMFLGRCGRVDLFGGDEMAQRNSLKYLRDILVGMPKQSMILPGHRYVLSSGQNPTFMLTGDFLSSNEAIIAVDHDEQWNALTFLRFDDQLSRRARAQQS